jgi:hypothetical protein
LASATGTCLLSSDPLSQQIHTAQHLPLERRKGALIAR